MINTDVHGCNIGKIMKVVALTLPLGTLMILTTGNFTEKTSTHTGKEPQKFKNYSCN